MKSSSPGVDARGCAIAGATPAAAQAYERAMALHAAWRGGVDEAVATAIEEAPGFVMALLLAAVRLAGSRDPRRVRMARPLLERARRLPAHATERAHVAALEALLGDDYEGAKARLGELLRRQPRDLLALQVAHSLDYVTGDLARLAARVEAVLPAWSAEVPGYHAVLAMHAFGLCESGEYARAEEAARRALALEPLDARAHHVMAHVYEMTGRPLEGIRWLERHVDAWAGDTAVATHGWWHLALFHLARGRVDAALALYDEQVRRERSGDLADLIDASALLWRIALQDGEPGRRWVELAEAWSPMIDDAFCSFSDLHAMLAFVGAGDRARALRLERVLIRAAARPTRHGESTRRLGLTACRAVMASGAGDDARVMTLLGGLPATLHRLGGSHAQRDVLELTRQRALQRLRSGAWGRDAMRAA